MEVSGSIETLFLHLGENDLGFEEAFSSQLKGVGDGECSGDDGKFHFINYKLAAKQSFKLMKSNT